MILNYEVKANKRSLDIIKIKIYVYESYNQLDFLK